MHNRSSSCAWAADTFPVNVQAQVKKVNNHTWEVVVDYVGSPGHELGWTPDGNKFMMMNKYVLAVVVVQILDSLQPTRPCTPK